jgi:hypothetical protein
MKPILGRADWPIKIGAAERMNDGSFTLECRRHSLFDNIFSFGINQQQQL